MFWKYSIIVLIIHLCYLFSKINGLAECQSAKQNCSQCISISYECFWCEDLDFPSGKSRCDTAYNLKVTRCDRIVPDNRPTPAIKMIKNSDFSNKKDEIRQLKPQEVSIKLRSRSKVTVDISYKRAEDYPMDLYYLMDLSCTMQKVHNTLINVGGRLADTLKKTTRNFQIGFGSFVDKPVMPFASFKLEPLDCGDKKVEPPYSFSHRQTLTDNSEEFVNQVRGTGISGNVDNPEGTLDALMQVLTCKNEIGWRKESTKIIVVATDAEFHYAGDGKLAGIITPNDGECHLVNNNYTYYNLTDYPSMYQIAEKAQGFNILFSVDSGVKPVYEKLKNIIGTNAQVASLSVNDNEMVKLINTTYHSIRSKVELRAQKPPFVDIEFYSMCQTNRRMKTSECDYQEIREIIFEAEITLKYCPTDTTKTYPIRIGSPKNNNEVLLINLEVLCGCDCDNRGQANDNHCSRNGTLACGICKCNGKIEGPKCDCDPEQPTDPRDPEKYCKNPNRTTSICSGHGNCVCNKCNCTKAYQGKYCEIEKYDCFPNNNINSIECNGLGICLNGKCECYPGYSGKLCDCMESNSTCIKDDKLCSGLGKCVCGDCKCSEVSTTGKYCQFCPSCEKDIYCKKILECVPEICKEFYGSEQNCTQILSGNCSDFRFGDNYVMVNTSQELDNSSSTNSYKTQCRFQTSDNECGFEFSYEQTNDDSTNKKWFRVLKATKNCKTKLDLVVVSGSVVAGTLLVGLALLLLWKLLTEIWDRKEYARFQKELSKVNWEQSENPLYREAKTTFANPMFALRERVANRLSRITDRFSRRFDVNNTNT